MNLSQSLHGSILFQEAKGLPESDLGLFSLLFLFWKCNGHVPESPWSYSRKWMTSSSQTFSLDLFFLFLFQGHNSLVQKYPWTFFIVVFVFVLRMQWPRSKKSPWSYSKKSMTSSSSRCLACLWAQRCSMTEAEIRHFSWNICFLSAGQNLLAENKRTPGYSTGIIFNLINI